MFSRTRSVLCTSALLTLMACHASTASNDPTAHQRAAPPEEWATADSDDSSQGVQAQGPQADDTATPKADARPKDRFTIGTFNVDYAFDEVDDRSESANSRNAPTEADWDWKVERIGSILVEKDLDIVALQSIGGRREIVDIAHYVLSNGGPNYDVAYIEGTDRITGQQVAILSRFLIHDARRFDIAVTKHLTADIMLPDYTQLVVINAQLRGGRYGSQTEFRRNEARRLQREIIELRKSGPVLVLGDIGSHFLPENEEYASSAPGMFAFADTKSEDDDCFDSGDSYLAQLTHTSGDARARMFFCGIKPDIDSFDVVGETVIVKGDIDDPKKNPWTIPTSERDTSSHYLLSATVNLAKKTDQAK